MSSLNELYQEMIIDHGRKPRNFYVSPNATVTQAGFNPLCGDHLTIYLREEDGKIVNISFQGQGCAISMASTSLMTEAVKNKSKAEVEYLYHCFHQMIVQKNTDVIEKMGKLGVLSGVAAFPSRIKCATLAWHTILAALQHKPTIVSTEDEK